jgi:hypothetical protein
MDSRLAFQQLLVNEQRCGESFFGDVEEYRADGVEELTEKMSRSTSAKFAVTSYSKASTNQSWTFKAPVWARQIAGVSSFAQARTSNSTGCLPQHNVPSHGTPLTSATPATNAAAPLKPTLHLLACTHRTHRRKCLLQDPIDSVSTDRALFSFMKRQLQHNRSRIRSILAMRSLQGMFFVKVSHNPAYQQRSSTNTSSAFVWATLLKFETTIPVVPQRIQARASVYLQHRRLSPSPNAEYRCSPAGPLATWPPILSQDLIHMLSLPQCINEQETWVLDQLPKRAVGELQACVGQPAEG